jgi:hypothetical protein
MAEEVMVKEVDEGPGLWDRIKGRLQPREEEMTEDWTGYERGYLDRRVENYIDAHFDEYVTEYGLVTKLDVETYEERFADMQSRVSALQAFTRGVDAEVTSLERRAGAVEASLKKGKK